MHHENVQRAGGANSRGSQSRQLHIASLPNPRFAPALGGKQIQQLRRLPRGEPPGVMRQFFAARNTRVKEIAEFVASARSLTRSFLFLGGGRTARSPAVNRFHKRARAKTARSFPRFQSALPIRYKIAPIHHFAWFQAAKVLRSPV